MTISVALAVLVGVLCILNLLLTFGVLRRLREHAAALEQLAGNASSAPAELLELVGKPLPDYASGSPQLLGFFRAGCGPCVVQARKLAELSQDSGSQLDTRAVVTGDGPKFEALVEALRDVPVVVEPQSSQLVEDLEIFVLPSFLRLDADGVVLSADVTVEGALVPSRV